MDQGEKQLTRTPKGYLNPDRGKEASPFYRGNSAVGRSFEQKITEDLDLAGDLLRKKSARETCADCSFKTMRVCRTLSADYPAAPVAVSRWRVAARGHQLSQAVPPAVACRRLPPPRPVPRRASRKSAAPFIPRSKRTETWPR